MSILKKGNLIYNDYLHKKIQKYLKDAVIVSMTDFYLDSLLDEIERQQARIRELEQGWTAIEPDSWTVCPHPCEVRYDAQGKPTHYRALQREDKC